MSNVGVLVKQFNWRFIVVRILVNAVTLLLIALFVPKIYFVDRSILNLFVLAIALGLLNALIKPIIQFLTLPYIFATYGLILAIVNALLLLLLAFLFPTRFAVESLFWLFIAGALMGILSSMLESMFGLSMPIIPDDTKDLRRYVEEQRPSIVTHLLDTESELQTHGVAEAHETPALADSKGEAVELPSPAEVPPKDPLDLEESHPTASSGDNPSAGVETLVPSDSANDIEDGPAVTKKRDVASGSDSTSQLGTQEGDQ